MSLIQLFLVTLAAIIASCENDILNMELALLGYDPFMAEPSIYPDPGSRGQIFDTFTQLDDGSIQMSPFITKALSNQPCTLNLASKSLKNYNQYEKANNLWQPIAVEMNKELMDASERHATDDEKIKIRKFFQETDAEIITVTNKCAMHLIEVASFATPTFTNSFSEALKSLHQAAKEPNSTKSIDVYRRFVNIFGTHYMKKTYMGSKLTFEKRFPRRAATSATSKKRQECVKAAAHSSIKNGVVDIVSIEETFSRESENCSLDGFECLREDIDYLDESDLPPEKVVSLGPLCVNGPEDCSRHSAVSVPISFELEPLSSLFATLSFSISPEVLENTTGEDFNASATSAFFKRMNAKYCHLILGKNCTAVDIKGCGINSVCARGEKCVNDTSCSRGYHCHPKVQDLLEPNENLVNAARHRPVTGSPWHEQSGYICTLEQVTNGLVSNTKYFYRSKIGMVLPYVVVDLGRVHTIWAVRMMPRRDALHTTQFLDYSIRTGTHVVEGSDFSSYSEIVLFPGPIISHATWIEHKLRSPLCGRYVSVQRMFNIPGELAFDELEVMVAAP